MGATPGGQAVSPEIVAPAFRLDPRRQNRQPLAVRRPNPDALLAFPCLFMADTDSPFRPYHLWIARLLLVVGVGILLDGFLQLWQARQLARHGDHGQAAVVDYKVFPADKHSGTWYLPILRFVDPAGKAWEKNDSQGADHRLYDIGQNREVIYPPSSPGDFKVNTWADVWGGAVFAIGLGAFATLLFYGLLVYVHHALARPEFGSRWTWLDPYLLPVKVLFRLFG